MAEDKKKEIDVTVIEVTEEYLKEKLYEIRGKRVLLDADLAEIYGYTNKRFNEQVRNNIEKFDSDFMFELTDDETEYLRTNFSTANISSKSRYNPHVFTEQGLYMLMTVLKGPLAVKQSKALIRTFKKMKDYILENRDLIGQRELLQLSMETANNRIEISKINSDMISLEKQISDVAEGLKNVVTKSEIADMMNSFISENDEKWLMFNAKFSSADEVYESIYRQAKSSIYVVDNYIGLRTLVHLKNSPTGVNIILFSDNVGNNKLHNIEYADFRKEYPTVKLSIKKTGGIFHDRFIVLDYGTADERVFLCGASSKDAGARITSIVEDYGTAKYNSVIAEDEVEEAIADLKSQVYELKKNQIDADSIYGFLNAFNELYAECTNVRMLKRNSLCRHLLSVLIYFKKDEKMVIGLGISSFNFQYRFLEMARK